MSKEDISKRVLKMEESLKRCLVGQERAITAVSRVLRRARAGLRDMKKPIACFVFTGPYGVGKTELAKLIAAEYFGSKEAMVKFDRMSEYYTLDQLLNRFSRIFGERPPHHVLLFDQILGANEQVLDFLLKILNDGVFREYDFTNTIIILKERYSNHEDDDFFGPYLRPVVAQNLNKLYNVDDFVDRIDELVVFEKLRAVQFREILDLVLVDFYEKMGKLRVEISNSLKEMLISKGCSDSEFSGAKWLRGEITKVLEDNLANKILDGTVTLTQTQTVEMDLDDKGNVTVHLL